jgi:hypothetical protein
MVQVVFKHIIKQFHNQVLYQYRYLVQIQHVGTVVMVQYRLQVLAERVVTLIQKMEQTINLAELLVV